MAFAGFSPGEAEGLRRAMSRKRSDAAIRGLPPSASSAGAMAARTTSTRRLAERVWTMVKGFSGFGFPKAHGAAFGLLAYQSTWLRVHYGPEFLCSLLNEQPMGFYPPDALAHEAQRRGIAVLAADVNASAVECTVERRRTRRRRAARARLRAGRAAPTRSRRWWPPARPAGRSARSATSPRAPGPGAPALEQLAWSGACDALPPAGDRRAALWQLGVAAPGRAAGATAGTQLALPLDLPAAPRAARARALGGDARRLRDHRRDPGAPPARRSCAPSCPPARSRAPT